MSLVQQTNFDERRDSIRAKRIVSVKHRLARHNDRKASGPRQMSLTEDMSASGLLFVSAMGYEKGDWLEVQVVMSGIVDIFNGFGQVVRSSSHKGGFYYVAIKYVDLKPKMKTRKAKSVLN